MIDGGILDPIVDIGEVFWGGEGEGKRCARGRRGL